ncbi:TetR/AcrR family transcriptional regulator [Yinghuangia aomiensis]
MVARLVRELDVPDAELRAGLCGAQLTGVAFTRYVLLMEPLASADTETLVAAVGPALQRHRRPDSGPGATFRTATPSRRGPPWCSSAPQQPPGAGTPGELRGAGGRVGRGRIRTPPTRGCAHSAATEVSDGHPRPQHGGRPRRRQCAPRA